MTDCDDIRNEIPGYLRGELGPRERELAGAHLQNCAACRREARTVAEAHRALQNAALPPGPATDLAARVFEAIAAKRDRGPTRVPTRLERAATALAPALGAAAVVLAVLSANWHSDVSDLRNEVKTMRSSLGPTGTPVGTIRLWDLDASPNTKGYARVEHLAQDNYRLVLAVHDLEPCPPGYHYELWLIGWSGNRVPGGSFRTAQGGQVQLPFPLGVEPSRYHRIRITLEPDGGEPAPNGHVVLEADLSSVGP